MDDKIKKHKKSEADIREKQLASEVHEDFTRRALERRVIEGRWQLCLNFLCGNQNLTLTGAGELVNEDRQFAYEQRAVFNHIAPLIETRLAKLTRVRPTLSVRAEGREQSEIAAAKLSSRIVRSAFDAAGLPDRLQEGAMWSETVGTAFYRVDWNADSGTEIEGGVRAGEVQITVVPPFEIYPDDLSCMDIGSQHSIIHARAVRTADIESAWGVRPDDEEVEIFSLESIRNPAAATSAAGRKGYALVIERFCRPDGVHKNGRHTVVCGQKVLFDGELPYINGAAGGRGYPFAMQCAARQTGCFFGVSVIERCIPVQRAYNALKNRKHELLSRIAGGVLAVEDGSADIDALAEEGLFPGKIVVYRQGSRAPQFMDAGHVPPEFSHEEERLLNEFIIISGVSEVSRDSRAPSSVSSGVALQLLIEQDDTRLSLTAESIRSAVRQMGRQALWLYKQFAGEGRLAKVAGEDGEAELIYFRASDITAEEVVLDTENELSQTPAQKKNAVLELLKLGLLSDGDGRLSERTKFKVLEIMGYGSFESGQDLLAMHVRRATLENLKLINNGALPELIDEHSVHIDEHTRYMLSAEYESLSPQKKQAYERHIEIHRQMAAGAADAAETGGADG